MSDLNAIGIPTRLNYDGHRVPIWPREIAESHRVYFIQAGSDGPIKVGFTTDLAKRIRALQTASPAPLRLVAAIIGTFALETLLHHRLRSKKLVGEWFSIDEDRVYHEIQELWIFGLVSP